MTKKIVIFVLLVVSGFACSLLQKSTTTATKPLRLYDPTERGLHPDYYVYHNTLDESTLFFRLFANELLFNQANPEMKTQSRVTLKYNLYSSFADRVLDQSGNREFVINQNDIADYYTANIKIPTEEGKSYFLELILTDQIRQISQRSFLLLDRFNPASQQNFMVLTFPDNQIGFEKFYYPEEQFRIITNKTTAQTIRIAYHAPVFTLPRPPYQTDIQIDQISRDADSVWTVNHDNQKLYQLESEGIYVFYPDPESMHGLYLSNLGDNFPQIKTAEDMIAPLQYLATPQEYADLQEAAAVKEAVDEFWLDKAGSFSTARELIRVYYNRVVFANLYFTTDRPGWMTDRGMIYLVFGHPEMVNKTETSEEWIYTISGSNRKYRYTFNLTPDPVKAYEYSLHRSETHRPNWNRALQSWREGRIFAL